MKQIIFGLILLLFFSAQVQAKSGLPDHVIGPSGLRVVFPEGFDCEPISSPFASLSRYDGSSRRGDRNQGRHGGIDISLTEGTPLLAVADGEVIALGEGAQLEGIFLWLLHTPEETGLPYYVFSKYQHLSKLPTLKISQRVKAGEAIALSGATGTRGGHYGARGYPHLHLNTFFGPSREYEVRGLNGSMVRAQGAILDDPLILYLAGFRTLSEVRQLPEGGRIVRPAIVKENGGIHPQGSRVVWPLSCKEKSTH